MIGAKFDSHLQVNLFVNDPQMTDHCEGSLSGQKLKIVGV